MQELYYLDISRNAFSQFPDQLCLLSSLSILKASHNHLECIPSCIDLYRGLQHLDLEDNPFKYSLPSEGLLTLATDYRLTRLNMNRQQMKMLHPEVCNYLQQWGILPKYSFPRCPPMEDFSRFISPKIENDTKRNK